MLQKTAVIESTWCGQRGRAYEALSAGRSSTRIAVTIWAEDGKQGVAGSGFVRVLKGAPHSAKCLLKIEFADQDGHVAAYRRAATFIDELR
jgi:hypothetical protein